MIGSENIENLHQLLENVLEDKKIQNFEIKRLTAPGENYGSLMLKLDVTLKNKDNNKEQKLYLVAKKIPKDELLKESFNIQVTFKNEVAMYEVIVPILKEFQRENGIKEVISCFPQFYCARSNVNGSEVVDENAVLILKNLVALGYKNIDRTEGFNLESTLFILKDLAEFHAVPLALKLKKPDVFNGFKKYCHDFQFHKGLHEMFWGITRDIIKEDDKCAKLINKINLITEVDRPACKEPFATLTHYDLWSNNTMQKFSGNVVVDNKFLDFQFLSYGSPASDLFFFLWTSVQLSVLQNNFGNLLRFYHKYFVKTLSDLHCDISTFGYKSFLDEIKRQCIFEVGHTLQFVLFIVNGRNDRKEDIKLPDDIDDIKESVTLKAKQKVWYMLKECERRGWLYKK